MALTRATGKQVTVKSDATGGVVRSLHDKLSETVSVKDFGAVGDGVTDDTAAIQAAIDSGANVVYIPEGEYMISRSTSTDGHTNYGLVINRDNLVICGVRGSTKLKRLNSDISTYALAYPLIHIGSVEISDSSVASNISIRDMDLFGNDTQHSITGNSLGDFRTAIHIKSATNLEIKDITFWSVDSSSIYFAPPRFYSYVTSTQLNTNTYSEHAKIEGCTFWAEPHTTTGRAFIHAVVVSGVNDVKITNNHFSWCDDAINGGSTYDVDAVDAERKVATYTHTGVDYLRCGRDVVISNNTMVNSSEHTIYLNTANTTITGNTISVDSDYCQGDIKLRGQNMVVTGNIVTTRDACVNISELSRNISITGNTLFRMNDSAGGVIGIDTAGIKSYVDNRPHFTVDPNNYPRVENIVISDNVIKQKDVTKQYGFAIRLYTDGSSVTGYPDGTLHNVTISNNIVENAKVGIMSYAAQARNIKVHGNTFRGGSFTSSGFDGTDLQGYAVLGCADNYQYNILQFDYSNNKSVGFKYIMGIVASDGSAGGGQSGYYYRPPRFFVGNQFDYGLDLSEAYGSGYWYSFSEECTANKGTNMMARNGQMDAFAPNNSIYIVGLSNSKRRGSFLFDGTNLRYYSDDNGTIQYLNN